jgi:cytochrome b561
LPGARTSGVAHCISWPLDDGTLRLDIIAETHVGIVGSNTRGGSMTQAGYSSTAKTLHWLIVGLLVAQYIFAWTMPHIGRNTPVTTLISLHFTFGVMILAVAIVRVVWRTIQGEPVPLDGVPPWQAQSARIIHWLLYVLLLLLPILGSINASWRGMPIVFFGIELPKPVSTRSSGWGWTGDVHSLLAYYVMLPLIGLHIASGLYHYFIRRDRVLQRMLPGGG